MGHILSHPVTSKHVRRNGCSWLRVGFAEMQGFRVAMEDQHIIAIPLDHDKHNLALFAVFDGHSGGAAAEFMSRSLRNRVAALPDPTDGHALKAVIRQLDDDFLTDVEHRAHGCTACFVVAQASPTFIANSLNNSTNNTPTPSSTPPTLTSAVAASPSPQPSSSPPPSTSSSSNSSSSSSSSSSSYINLTIGNLGDSRAVLIGSDGSIRFVTRDHKPDDSEETRRIRAAGGRVTLGRVDGELAMSRAIGDFPYKDNDSLPPIHQKVIADPDIYTIQASPNDLLLIICDGLVEKLSQEQVCAFVREQYRVHRDDPAHICTLLIDYSLKSGSKDNMSAMLIAFTDGAGYSKSEFRPGPFAPASDDRKFVECYLADGRRAGLDGEELLKLAKEVDRTNAH